VSLVALLAGCGNLTAGGFGEAEVTASGNAESEPAPTGPARAAMPHGSTVGPQPVGVAGALDGTLEVELTLFLDAADGSAVALHSGGAVLTELDLAGGTDRVALDRVPVGAYGALRMVFTSVEADVLGGLLVDGLPFIGAVTVALPGGTLTVVRPVAVEVREDERVTLLVDFDADAWLTEVDPLTRIVAGGVFAAELDVVGP
jgi:hypothetical protein